MNDKSDRAKREEAILAFWRDNKIFEKTLEKEAPKGEFVFYEGPPTANAKPALHHLEARVFKDALPRYKTMRGYHVPRKAGWDTHGLPVELQIEKKLGFTSKKDIEAYGIEKFNKECKESVFEYIGDWEKFTERIGYWVNFKEAYYTFKNSYIETLWSIVAEVEKQGLLYKDYKVLPWCPRCGTALSSHELAQGYQDVKDISMYAKFPIKGFDKAYFLAWTTTPWTLPGNVALAVGADIDYVEAKVGEEIYVLAKERLSVLAEPYEIIAEHKGSEMVGMAYEPLYNFIPANDKAYKVYAADFVTTTDGTGIVHTAVMYGQDDFELGTKAGLPKYHLVDDTGHYKPEAGWLAGKSVVEESTAVEILKDLQHKNLLFKKESYTHSYPFCWRCKTRLVYYARDSWYIAMSKLRDELVKENEKINWEPEYIKEGRFGEWLREIKDWAISRERYWGTPLPVWQAKDGKRLVVDSLETLKTYAKKSGNRYFLMRHGGTEGNAKEIVSYKNEAKDHLTEEGKAQAKASAQELKGKRIDLIVASPFARTRETAEIVRSELGLPESALAFDARLREVDPGDFDGKNWNEYHEYMYAAGPDWYTRQIPGGESLAQVARRMGEALYELERKHAGKHILIVTHGGPAWVAHVVSGLYQPDHKEYKKADTHVFVPEFKRFTNAEVRELPFVPLPHNENFELDLHRPYIDEIALEKEGEEYRRTKEVMDVWFDSGAMPFAQDPEHVRFPADFISEAIDQTRGWFYTLHAIGILMGKGHAYNNVICLGHILDKEGKKMSKSIGNVVNPWEMIDKYGVDALRLWMYSVNQPGESKNFDERTVDELNKRIFNLLDNVYSFYDLYRDKSLESDKRPESGNILDTWILARLDKLAEYMTEKLDGYKLLEPVRAYREFVDDLSTWYVRRSRERVKEGDKVAKQTLHFVLCESAKLIAPFAPFFAEELYQKLRAVNGPESVHLTAWPEAKRSLFDIFKKKSDVLERMAETRNVVSLALEQRQKANIKVRQPLQKLAVKSLELAEEYLAIIKDEINVKEIEVNPNLEAEVKLDINLTPELVEEGRVRDAIRTIQEWRKEQNLKPGEQARYAVPVGEEAFFQKHAEAIKKAGNIVF
jgi:isoleucyl-tRNA synthetase